MRRKAGMSIQAPRRERSPVVISRRNSWATCLATLSASLSTTLPVKPSVTTTSTVPCRMSRPSTLPMKLSPGISARS